MRQTVPALADTGREHIEALFCRALKTIDEALQATIKRSARDGTLVALGPDHRARLTAVKRFIELVTAARPPSGEPEQQRKGITWQELQSMVRERRRDGPGKPAA